MDEIKRLKATIEEIEQDNRALSKIIHKDYKILSTMELIARTVVEATENQADLNKKASLLLEQLQEEISNKKGIVAKYQKDNRTLPETRVSSIDAMLNYMLQRANETDVDFDVIITKSIIRLTEDIIDKEKLRTLIADLLENAIIATKSQEYKKIMLTIGAEDSGDGNGAHYVLSVQDSGEYFDGEVLRNLGKKQITTHAGDGGSGIGMIQTFDILNETKASFLIEEYPQKKYSFTKKITVRFDGKNEVKINALTVV
jgi:signal transduction histidine kinase